MMVTNERIQSVLAKAITNVNYIRFLQSSRSEDAALIGTANGSSLPDLNGIVRFSAFIAKVQHNFLWNDYPATFRLIHKFSLEIEIFAAYLPQHQVNKQSTLSFDEKIDRFASFLKKYLHAAKSRKHKIVAYVFRHEDTIRSLRKKAKLFTAAGHEKPLSARAILMINGCFEIHGFPMAPGDLIAASLEGRKVRLSKNPGWFAYWLDAQQNPLQIISVSEEAKLVMEYINNSNTVSQVLKKSAWAIGKDDATTILEFLLENKIVYLK